MERIDSYNKPIETIRIKGASIKRIIIEPSITEETEVYVNGNLSEYEIQLMGEVLKISTVHSRIMTISIDEMNTPKIEEMRISIPSSLNPDFKIDAVGAMVVMDYKEPYTIRNLRLDGVKIDAQLTNVSGLIEVNSVNSSIWVTNFGGRIYSNGVSNTIHLTNTNNDVTVKLNGLSSQAYFNEGEAKANYRVQLAGLNGKMCYYADRRTSFGILNYTSPHIHGAPAVRVEGNGLSAKVSVN